MIDISIEELKKAARPLMELLNEKADLMTVVKVDANSAEIYSAICGTGILKEQEKDKEN